MAGIPQRDHWSLRIEDICLHKPEHHRQREKAQEVIPVSILRAIGIKGGIAIALLLFAAAQTVRIEGFWFIDGFKDVIAALRVENGVLRLDLDNIKAAQKIATERAMEAKRLAEAKAAKEKELSDERLENALRDKRALAARYAAANRLRGAAGTSAGSASGTDLPCAPATAESPDGACGDAELLAISKPDFDILVTNTIRLQEAVTWATSP